MAKSLDDGWMTWKVYDIYIIIYIYIFILFILIYTLYVFISSDFLAGNDEMMDAD